MALERQAAEQRLALEQQCTAELEAAQARVQGLTPAAAPQAARPLAIDGITQEQIAAAEAAVQDAKGRGKRKAPGSGERDPSYA